MSAGRTLFLLDDNDDFRATAKWWLSGAGYEVVEFGEPQAAIEALKALAPAARASACLLLDVRMPALTGLQVHDMLIEAGVTGPQARPALPVVYMTGHGDVPLAVQAMEKGAVTFLEKPFQDSALEFALARAFEAGARAAQPPSERDGGALAQGQAADDDALACAEYQSRYALLSLRERQVMQGVVEGKISKMIARELDISTKTVELHRSRVMAKMQAESVVHLTRMALRQQVL